MKETKKQILIRLNKNTDLVKKEERRKKEQPLINISLTLPQLYGLSVLIDEHRRTTDTIKWGAYGQKKQGARILDRIIIGAIVSYEDKQSTSEKNSSGL